jgi:hypothetical protein
MTKKRKIFEVPAQCVCLVIFAWVASGGFANAQTKWITAPGDASTSTPANNNCNTAECESDRRQAEINRMRVKITCEKMRAAGKAAAALGATGDAEDRAWARSAEADCARYGY